MAVDFSDKLDLSLPAVQGRGPRWCTLVETGRVDPWGRWQRLQTWTVEIRTTT